MFAECMQDSTVSVSVGAIATLGLASQCTNLHRLLMNLTSHVIQEAHTCSPVQACPRVQQPQQVKTKQSKAGDTNTLLMCFSADTT